MAAKMDVRLIPYELEKGMEETARVIEGITPGQSVGIFIGPEGGFEESESNRPEQPALCRFLSEREFCVQRRQGLRHYRC